MRLIVLALLCTILASLLATGCTDEIPRAPNDDRGPVRYPALRQAGTGIDQWCAGAGGIVSIAEPVLAPDISPRAPLPPSLLEAIEDIGLDVRYFAAFELHDEYLRFPYVEIVDTKGTRGEARLELARVQPADGPPAWLVVEWETFFPCEG